MRFWHVVVACLLARPSSAEPARLQPPLLPSPPLPWPTSAWGDDDPQRGGEFRSAAHGNATGACPWDPLRAWHLALHPPAPTGTVNEVWLPNDAKPGLELSLTVAGEEDKYPFYVPAGGFGGRQVCSWQVQGGSRERTKKKL